ncbi:ParB/RepB/Spo0J family partition protein [Actinomadura litoris]|nr:ParB N-terminal domain-containing protein [Actinomadura litoris]
MPARSRGSMVVSVSILDLRPGDSPRLRGEDKAHVMRLAETEGPLPPILVDRRTMRVIDGVHRLMAASLRGQETIEVEFFDGSPEDAFVLGVEANVRHGLPLSQADRHAAALRILMSQPDMSDRAIAKTTGLGTRVVAEMRRSTDAVPQLNTRVGRDGRVRPLNGGEGRRRAAELMRENPRTSLRQVARIAGVSPATALDVRRRLERGEEPVPAGRSAPAPGSSAASSTPTPSAPPKKPKRSFDRDVEAVKVGEVRAAPSTVALEKLLRDPSLRHSEQGRRLLRMLKENAAGATNMTDFVASVPSHCLTLAMQIARQNSQMWLEFARELDMRAKISDPWLLGRQTAQ